MKNMNMTSNNKRPKDKIFVELRKHENVFDDVFDENYVYSNDQNSLNCQVVIINMNTVKNLKRQQVPKSTRSASENSQTAAKMTILSAGSFIQFVVKARQIEQLIELSIRRTGENVCVVHLTA